MAFDGKIAVFSAGAALAVLALSRLSLLPRGSSITACFRLVCDNGALT